MKVNCLLTSILTIILLLMPCAVNAESCIPKGEGTTESPYLIYTLEDLKRIGNDEEWTLDKHYKMMNDIILEKPKEGENNWSPIGGFHSAFTGTFDGNGKVISGMVIQNKYTLIGNDIGLFSVISGKNAKIERLGITDVIINIESKSHVVIGALAGAAKATIKDCYSTGSISGGNITGGLIGMFVEGTIEGCYSNANVQDSMSGRDNSTGGLIGDLK